MPGTGLIDALLQREDDAPALCQHDAHTEVLRWSFRELQAARRYCASLLRKCGLKPGDKVVLVCGDVPPFLAVVLAALQLRLCLLPLHPDQDEHSLDLILAAQSPELAVAEATAVRAMALLRRRVARCLVLDAATSDWLRCLYALLPHPAQRPPAGVETPDAMVFHSSGSTGHPKAIHYSRAQLDAFLEAQQRLFAPFNDEAEGQACVTPTARVNVLPLAHWGGLSFCLQALHEGRAVHLLGSFQAGRVLTVVERNACRLLMLVPAMYRELLPRLEQDCPTSLRYCLTMGEAMPAALAAALQRRHGLLLCTAYGMTEALSGLAHGAVPWDEVPHGSCGQLAFGELQLVAADGTVQPPGGPAEGELWVRNVTTQPRYRDPELLREKYVDGWYRSGDCFRRDAAGHYHFLARLDAMCVHNGRNVYPQQVEAVFIEHSGVQACVAVPLQLEDGRRRLGVVLVAAPGVELCPQELLDFYLLHGAHYAAPAFLLQAGSLPLTPSGKPERTAIAALLQQAYDRVSAARAARTGLLQ